MKIVEHLAAKEPDISLRSRPKTELKLSCFVQYILLLKIKNKLPPGKTAQHTDLMTLCLSLTQNKNVLSLKSRNYKNTASILNVNPEVACPAVPSVHSLATSC